MFVSREVGDKTKWKKGDLIYDGMVHYFTITNQYRCGSHITASSGHEKAAEDIFLSVVASGVCKTSYSGFCGE